MGLHFVFHIQSLASGDAFQVEGGWYLSDNVFMSVQVSRANQRTRPGVRFEWQLADAWQLDAFLEDQYRDRLRGFGDVTAFDLTSIWGLFLSKRWGY